MHDCVYSRMATMAINRSSRCRKIFRQLHIDIVEIEKNGDDLKQT
jgi:hypothetical protein